MDIKHSLREVSGLSSDDRQDDVLAKHQRHIAAIWRHLEQLESSISVNAEDSLTLSVGSAQITLKKDGTIVLKGKDITIDASGKVAVKASGDISMKGAKILQN